MTRSIFRAYVGAYDARDDLTIKSIDLPADDLEKELKELDDGGGLPFLITDANGGHDLTNEAGNLTYGSQYGAAFQPLFDFYSTPDCFFELFANAYTTIDELNAAAEIIDAWTPEQFNAAVLLSRTNRLNALDELAAVIAAGGYAIRDDATPETIADEYPDDVFPTFRDDYPLLYEYLNCAELGARLIRDDAATDFYNFGGVNYLITIHN